MAEKRALRRLAAILAADVVGYSRLVEIDEAGTLAALKARRNDLLVPAIAQHNGRVVKVMGDGVLVEFSSAVNAVACAIELQKQFAAANEGVADGLHIVLRIGVNLGDVEVEGGDLYGEGVIIAVRLQAMAVPGGICVSGSVHEQVAGKLNTAFDDLGLCEVKNSSKPVRVYRARIVDHEQMQAPPSAALSIAVLPLDNMSGDPSQQYLSDGMAEDIITELSRFRNLAVAARHASFHFRGKSASLPQIARELDVAYILEGSLRKTGDRIRVTVQLIDAKTGNHVWAERYDREARDIFMVQDEIVSTIVNTLEGRIIAASASSARKRPTASWSVYDCLLQGRELCNNYREPDAVPHFERAVAIDPKFALGYAWLSLAQTVTYKSNADQSLLNKAEAAARMALMLAPNESTAHWAAAMAATYGKRLADAGRHFDRAIALNPADVQIRADRAQWLQYMGRYEEALAAIDEALKQGPFSPPWFWAVRGEILFEMQRYGEAIETFDNLPEKKLRDWFFLAAAEAHLGNMSKAAEALQVLLQNWPAASLSSLPFVIPSTHEGGIAQLRQGLRKAGLPE
jgi:adenylate cyclase